MNVLAFFAGAAQAANKSFEEHDKFNKELQLKLYEKSLGTWEERQKEYLAAKSASDQKLLHSAVKAVGFEDNWKEDATYRQRLTDWLATPGTRDKILASLDPGEMPNLNNFSELNGPHPLIRFLKGEIGMNHNAPAVGKRFMTGLTAKEQMPDMPMPDEKLKKLDWTKLPTDVQSNYLQLHSEHVARTGEEPSQQLQYAMLSEATRVANELNIRDKTSSINQRLASTEKARQEVYALSVENRGLEERWHTKDKKLTAETNSAESAAASSVVQFERDKIALTSEELGLSIKGLENQRALIDFDTYQETSQLKLALLRAQANNEDLSTEEKLANIDRLYLALAHDRRMNPVLHQTAVARMNREMLGIRLDNQAVRLGSHKNALAALEVDMARAKKAMLPFDYHIKSMEAFIKTWEAEGAPLEFKLKEGRYVLQSQETWNAFMDGKAKELNLTTKEREEFEATMTQGMRMMQEAMKTNKSISEAYLAETEFMAKQLGIEGVGTYVKQRVAAATIAARLEGKDLSQREILTVMLTATNEAISKEQVKIITVGNEDSSDSAIAVNTTATNLAVAQSGGSALVARGAPGKSASLDEKNARSILANIAATEDPEYKNLISFWRQNAGNDDFRVGITGGFMEARNNITRNNTNLTPSEANRMAALAIQRALVPDKNGKLVYHPTENTQVTRVPLGLMEISEELRENISNEISLLTGYHSPNEIHTITVVDPKTGQKARFSPAGLYTFIQQKRASGQYEGFAGSFSFEINK